MSYFLFNGVSSDELGMIVTSPIIRPSWSPDENDYKLAGRTTVYSQKSKTYSNKSMTIETFVSDTGTENLQKIYKYLQGDGTLWLSSNPEEYLNVTISAPEPQAVALMSGVFPLKFKVKPFAYAVNPTIKDITVDGISDYVCIQNNGTLFSEPEISFRPQTQKTVITVNGADFIVNTPDGCSYESTVTINCEEEVIYFTRPEGWRYMCLQYTENDFPLFHTGDNYIRYTGAVQEMKINVKERFL